MADDARTVVVGYQTPLDSVLERDETLRWTGRPRQGLALGAGDAVRIGLSMFVGLLGVGWVWTLAVLTAWGRLSGRPYAVVLSSPGWLALLLGLLALAGRLAVEPWQRRRTWYGITDRRAIVVTDWFRRLVVARDLRGVDVIDVRRHRDGTGTITFDCPCEAIGQERLFGRGDASRHAFDRTADVDGAEAAIRTVRGAAPSSAPAMRASRVSRTSPVL
jgi:hypothetical protein